MWSFTAPNLTICGQYHYGLLIEPNIMYHNSQRHLLNINAFLFRRLCKRIGNRKCLTLITCLGVVHYYMLLFITGKIIVQEMMYEKYKCYYVTFNVRSIEKKFRNWKKILPEWTTTRLIIALGEGTKKKIFAWLYISGCTLCNIINETIWKMLTLRDIIYSIEKMSLASIIEIKSTWNYHIQSSLLVLCTFISCFLRASITSSPTAMSRGVHPYCNNKYQCNELFFM